MDSLNWKRILLRILSGLAALWLLYRIQYAAGGLLRVADEIAGRTYRTDSERSALLLLCCILLLLFAAALSGALVLGTLAGEERRVLRSPQFGAQRRRTIVTLHYAAQAAGEAARLEAEFSGTRQQPVPMPAQADRTRFEVPAGEPFAFSVTLCEGARLSIEQITFEEAE